MLNLVKKAILTGVGLGVLTKESIEELAREMKKEARLSENEGKELIDELMKKSDQAKIDVEAKVETLVSGAVGKLKLASKEDIAGLAERIERLEQAQTKTE